jgi:hypothetical protein
MHDHGVELDPRGVRRHVPLDRAGAAIEESLARHVGLPALTG